MIPIPFDATVTKADIEHLVSNQVREGRGLEYKQTLPGSSDDDKREFLADVSSFANGGGGDILYGVIASDGIPTNLIGVTANADSEILRMENLLRDGLDPRVPAIRLSSVDGFANGSVIVLRVFKSWVAPHMVIFRNCSRFYTRNSAGKHQMDIGELKTAFLLSDAVPEKMKRFHDERLGKILTGETPVPLTPDAKLIVHLLPVASFGTNLSFDVTHMSTFANDLQPVGAGGWDHRFNLDGYLAIGPGCINGGVSSYCQLFRNGQIESVSTRLIHETGNGNRGIASVAYEEDVIGAAAKYVKLLRSMEVPCPIVVWMTLTGVRGAHLFVNQRFASIDPVTFDRDTLHLPDALLRDYSHISDERDIAKLLRPVFDAVWNACGYPRSLNYDENGDWVPSR